MKRFSDTLPSFHAAMIVFVLLSFVTGPLGYAFNPQPEPPDQEEQVR